MKQGRKIYDASFKIRSVERSNDRSNLSDLAREHGIKVSLPNKWRTEYQQFSTGRRPGNGNLKRTPEQERSHELEKKIKDGELGRDILKKAISIFYSSF